MADYQTTTVNINRHKRIGNIIIFVEGEEPEFTIIENIFHSYLGYTITKCKRSQQTIIELQGKDKYSKITLLNAPTSNIKSIANEIEFYDYIYKNYALALNLDTINNPVYFIFDRDAENNRQGIVEKLIRTLTNSQNSTEEQNGLLLLSYPSIESFSLSTYKKVSHKIKIKLGKDLKQLLLKENIDNQIDDVKLNNAFNEFINFLIYHSIIKNENEVINKLNTLGIDIFKLQTSLYAQEKVFYCISQLIEILLDLQIIELN